MASIPPLLFPTLSFSMSALLMIFQNPLAQYGFTNPNSNNSLIPLALQTFSFLLHIAFLSAILLLIHHACVKSSFTFCLWIHDLTTGFTPVRSALCISTATLFLLEQSPSLFYDAHTNNFSIQMLHLLLFCDLTLAILLLCLRTNAAPDGHGTPRVISVAMVEGLAKMTAAMSLTIVAIAVYMMMMVLAIGPNKN